MRREDRPPPNVGSRGWRFATTVGSPGPRCSALDPGRSLFYPPGGSGPRRPPGSPGRPPSSWAPAAGLPRCESYARTPAIVPPSRSLGPRTPDRRRELRRIPSLTSTPSATARSPRSVARAARAQSRRTSRTSAPSTPSGESGRFSAGRSAPPPSPSTFRASLDRWASTPPVPLEQLVTTAGAAIASSRKVTVAAVGVKKITLGDWLEAKREGSCVAL